MKTEVAEVPTFKIARVGRQRKRKGAGFWFLRGAGAREGWSGAVGGSGLMGLGATKTFIAILAACAVGSAAIYAGNLSASHRSAASAEKTKIFASGSGDVKLEGDASNLPSNSNTIPNSLGYIAGSMDGLTPEERAQKAAEAAEARRKAEEEEAKKAAAEAGQAATDNKPVDPAALLAAAQADGGNTAVNALGRKFGQLSSGTGGGAALTGGAGLSGGVARQFASASFDKGDAGTLSALKRGAKPSASRAARSSLAASKVKGFAKQQLVKANALSQRGVGAGKAETAVTDATTAFDNNPGGNPITGPGIGKATTLSGPNDLTANPTPGPIGQTPVCSGTQFPDPNTGACVDAPTPKAENKTSWEFLALIAQGLLGAIALIAAWAMFAKGMMWGVPIDEAVLKVIGVLGGIISVLGLAVMAMGDYFEGGVFTAVGAFIALWALKPGLVGLPALTAAPAIVTSAAGMLLGLAAKMLKPAAAD